MIGLLSIVLVPVFTVIAVRRKRRGEHWGIPAFAATYAAASGVFLAVGVRQAFIDSAELIHLTRWAAVITEVVNCGALLLVVDVVGFLPTVLIWRAVIRSRANFPHPNPLPKGEGEGRVP